MLVAKLINELKFLLEYKFGPFMNMQFISQNIK